MSPCWGDALVTDARVLSLTRIMAACQGAYSVVAASSTFKPTRPTSGSCSSIGFTCRRKTYICISAVKDSHTDSVSSDGPIHETEARREPTEIADVSSAVTSLSRRALLGLSTAFAVALGGNLAGITSFLLGLNATLSRSLKLDVVYPINGYKRCLEKSFEFLYPNTWVGDQRLLYRAAERAEKKWLYGDTGTANVRTSSLVEPVVAFGPPGSSGELNVSVIVAPVPQDFRLDKLGNPTAAGNVILKSFIRNSKVTPSILSAKQTEDLLNGQKFLYYKLEFSVQGESFLRHNVSVYAAYNGQLFSMNAQTPESLWPDVKQHFLEMADSFKVRF